MTILVPGWSWADLFLEILEIAIKSNFFCVFPIYDILQEILAKGKNIGIYNL